jgi:hypothetical protein
MNRTYILFKMLNLAALLVLLGTGQALAAESPAPSQDAAAQAAQPGTPQAPASQETARPETIRLAWDRVGMVA